MNQSKYDSKSDPKHTVAQPAVAVVALQPATQVQVEAAPQQDLPASKANDSEAPTVLKADVAQDDSGEAMVSEGGHASPGKAPDAVREPDASIIAKNEPSKGSADGAADKPGLSAKSTS